MCMAVCERMCAHDECLYVHVIMYMWSSEDNLWELVFSTMWVIGIELRSLRLTASALIVHMHDSMFSKFYRVKSYNLSE